MNVPDMMRVKIENSLEKRIIDLIARDYAMVAGDKVRDMFAKDLVKLVNETIRSPHMMEVGQILWIGASDTEKPGYGKNSRNTRFTPVILTPIHRDDLVLMSNGYSFREIREQKIVRLFHEAKKQGAILTNADVGMVLGVSAGTISKQAREYMEREQKILPTRGIVHDIGRAITHKRIIIKLYLQGLLVPEIARRTDHSEEAVSRYIKAFEKVRMLRDRLDISGIVRTLEMSEYLVREYLDIVDECKQGGEVNV